MAMTPDERREFEELKRIVRNIQGVTDVPFIENAKRRIVGATVTDALATLTLGDLADVDFTSLTDGQVVKYTTTGTDRWVNGTDNIV